jgi:hypothetical protein
VDEGVLEKAMLAVPPQTAGTRLGKKEEKKNEGKQCTWQLHHSTSGQEAEQKRHSSSRSVLLNA